MPIGSLASTWTMYVIDIISVLLRKKKYCVKCGVGGMSRDYRLRVSNPYFLYLYVQNIRVWRLWAPRWPWARVSCTLCTPYCYATANCELIKLWMKELMAHLLNQIMHEHARTIIGFRLPIITCPLHALVGWTMSITLLFVTLFKPHVLGFHIVW